MKFWSAIGIAWKVYRLLREASPEFDKIVEMIKKELSK